MKSKEISKFQKYFTLFVICLGAGLIYKVAYLREAFYDPLQQALNISHEEVGALSTMYGTIALFCYIPGGILADKLPAKWLLSFSFLATGALTLWYATIPPYPVVKLIYGLMAVTTILTYWSAFVKAVRLLGDDSEQGRMFGLSEGIRSVGGTIGAFVVLAIVASATSVLGGLKWTLVFYGVVYIVVGIVSIIALPNEDRSENEKKSVFNLSEFVAAMKIPGTWLVTLLIFAWYTVYSLMGYTTPYLTNVFGLPIAVVGTLGIIRQYAIGIFSGPLAGFIGDKMGSSAKVLRWCAIGTIITVGGLLLLPNGAGYMIPMALTIILSAIVYAARGTYWATLSDAGIPIALTGAASGLISVLGYAPDVYIYTQVGRWLDTYSGATGYKMIFGYMLVASAVAFVAAMLISKFKAKSIGVEDKAA